MSTANGTNGTNGNAAPTGVAYVNGPLGIASASLEGKVALVTGAGE